MNRAARLVASLLTAAALVPLMARALPQLPDEPWELAPTYGRITDSARAMPLPPRAELAAVFDWDRDGQTELFASRVQHVTENECEYHLLILRPGPGSQARIERDAALRAECYVETPLAFVTFYVPPDPRDPIKLLFSTMGGSKWFATVDLLEPGFERPIRLFAMPSNVQLVDFEGVGTYHVVGWRGHPADEPCDFGMFGVRAQAKILVRKGLEFRPAWPSERSQWRPLMAQLADVDADGKPEVVSLEDNGVKEGDAKTLTDYRQRLAVYKMKGASFSEVAHAALPPAHTAFWISATKQGQVQVRTASPEKCAKRELPEGEGISVLAYSLRNGALQRIE